MTDETLDILETVFDRKYRDSRCLHAAWELLAGSSDAKAEKIKKTFLGEFKTILNGPDDCPNTREARRLVEESFVPCPKDERDRSKAFFMGSDHQTIFSDEHPRHRVVLTPFALQKTPVTNAQYELFDPGHRCQSEEYSGEDECPVVHVNWYMATMFCIWLGERYRLPTEAEWEYACRAGSTTAYCFGDGHQLEDYAWYSENSGGKAHPVGTLKANAWGLYDMHGNVWEWCSDWYDADYYQSLVQEQCEDAAAQNPSGPPSGSSRVVRGGSWRSTPGSCRSANRGRDAPGDRCDNLGFRVALVRRDSGK